MNSDTRSEPVFRDLFPRKTQDPAAIRIRAGALSSRNFLRLAVLLAVLFGIVHLVGLREYTSVLNGTLGNVEVGWRASVFLGATYILAYLGFVLLMPSLILAALLLKIAERFLGIGRPAKPIQLVDQHGIECSIAGVLLELVQLRTAGLCAAPAGVHVFTSNVPTASVGVFP